MKLNKKRGKLELSSFPRELISQKKGVSGVVTAVLLILLTIAAVGILWVVVQNFIGSGTKGISSSTACLNNGFKVVSAKNSSATLNVTAERTSGTDEVKEVKVFLVKSNGASSEVGKFSSVPSLGATSSLVIPQGGQGITIENGDKVKVAAVISDSSCTPSEEVAITSA